MQTRFQIREIDISKGYCLLVTDKNHSRVTFGFDNLDSAIADASSSSWFIPTTRSASWRR